MAAENAGAPFANDRRYPARKRRAPGGSNEEVIDKVLRAAESASKIIVFTGSGLSASSGMSMFSTKNGLYERARKKLKIQDGMKLFTYSFYKQRKADVQAFFAQIYSEAQSSRAAPGHYALADLLAAGRLQRHYTMNIDGLGEVVAMDTWHWEFNPEGSTVEMHGNIRQLVCPACHGVEPLGRTAINAMRSMQPIACSNCQAGELRFKVMLYDDGEGECVMSDDVFTLLEADLAQADMLLWVGISFTQSASTEYFKRVRAMLSSAGRLHACQQVLVNPSDDALFNLLSACSNTGDLNILDVRASSDELLPRLAERVKAAAAAAAAAAPAAVAVPGAAAAAAPSETPAPIAGAAADAAAAAVIEQQQEHLQAAAVEAVKPAQLPQAAVPAPSLEAQLEAAGTSGLVSAQTAQAAAAPLRLIQVSVSASAAHDAAAAAAGGSDVGGGASPKVRNGPGGEAALVDPQPALGPDAAATLLQGGEPIEPAAATLQQDAQQSVSVEGPFQRSVSVGCAPAAQALAAEDACPTEGGPAAAGASGPADYSGLPSAATPPKASPVGPQEQPQAQQEEPWPPQIIILPGLIVPPAAAGDAAQQPASSSQQCPGDEHPPAAAAVTSVQAVTKGGQGCSDCSDAQTNRAAAEHEHSPSPQGPAIISGAIPAPAST